MDCCNSVLLCARKCAFRYRYLKKLEKNYIPPHLLAILKMHHYNCQRKREHSRRRDWRSMWHFCGADDNTNTRWSIHIAEREANIAEATWNIIRRENDSAHYCKFFRLIKIFGKKFSLHYEICNYYNEIISEWNFLLLSWKLTDPIPNRRRRYS